MSVNSNSKTMLPNKIYFALLNLRKKKYMNIKNGVKYISFSRSERYFDKILISNRGEIACRIIKTAKKLGIKTVAVYSEPDYQSKHVNLSDEAICIGPAEANKSYLNMDNILKAIKQSGAQAVHPGYGFLSENANFVQLLEKENISFIGPPAEVIQKMGDKLESKRLAISAGVNTVPGFDGIVKDVNHCIEIAKNIGYPVMIKASAGGGGKGMRIAWKEEDIRQGFNLSTQEAISSFGDGRILLEKFITKPRHIEIQVLGDKFGNIVYLGERECSIQRRNQKIIEEAPSTFLDEKTRKEMSEQAIMLCKLLKYSSAGTVEFLVDENRNFYFLEMNTRLQVEHPVTECITGVDLVEQMIRIAAGCKLELKQNNIKYNGWAIESRIYAEDPFRHFGVPSVGKINKYVEPNDMKGVRLDSGVTIGSDISVYYDPLICKLISFGRNRKEAINKSIEALDNYVIRGVSHNIPLLRDILSERKFQNGDINTNYLVETYKNDFKGYQLKKLERNQLLTFASAVYAFVDNRYRIDPQKLLKSWDVLITLQDEKCLAKIEKENNTYQVKLNDVMFQIDDNFNIAVPLIQTKINKETCLFQLISKDGIGNFEIIFKGTVFNINIIPERIAKYLVYMQNRPKPKPSKLLKAPMAGLIKSLSCKIGDKVLTGQEICILEAMKMQNCITAESDGTIKNINIKQGDVVGNNDVLIEFE